MESADTLFARLELIEGGWNNVITKDMLELRIINENVSVTKELETNRAFRGEVTTFLGLPQKRCLATHMDQVGTAPNHS